MKTPFFLLIAFILTGCSTSWDPPPTGYESYQSRHPRIDVEQIKQDMKACGFPDVISYEDYYHNTEGFAQSALCMERKGYRNAVGRRGICSVDSFENTETCQKHLSETQGKKNQR